MAKFYLVSEFRAAADGLSQLPVSRLGPTAFCHGVP